MCVEKEEKQKDTHHLKTAVLIFFTYIFIYLKPRGKIRWCRASSAV